MSPGIVDYTTIHTTSHSDFAVTETQTVNATSVELVLQTEIAHVVYLVNVTENAISYETDTTTIGHTRTVADHNADPTTSTLVLVATALVESVSTETTLITSLLVPPEQTSGAASSDETTFSQTATESVHNEEECTLAEHHHRQHHRKHHHKDGKKHKKEDEDGQDDQDEDDYDKDDHDDDDKH